MIFSGEISGRSRPTSPAERRLIRSARALFGTGPRGGRLRRFSRSDGYGKGGEEPSGPGALAPDGHRAPVAWRRLRDSAAEFHGRWRRTPPGSGTRRIGPAGGEGGGGRGKESIGDGWRRPILKRPPPSSAPKTCGHAIMQPSTDATSAPKMGLGPLWTT
ncbi:MAG: hypothetical protein PHN90_10670 [Methanothrix sp.]|nr:hypothetical protein [Methanothrix harundinacea]MDD3566118.1 hypothetical protein [Methanothrix sp.]